MKVEDIKNILSKNGLKATIQRINVYKAMLSTKQHPTAEDIYNLVKPDMPTISLSTIYNTLDSLIDKNIIATVKTDSGTVRYDAFIDSHHHIYSEDGEEIADFYSKELDELLNDFFVKNSIPNFEIKEIKLQLKGNYIKNLEGSI